MGDDESRHPSLRPGPANGGFEHLVEISASPLGGVWASRLIADEGSGVFMARRIPRGDDVDEDAAKLIKKSVDAGAKLSDPRIVPPRRVHVDREEITVTSAYLEAEYLRDVQRQAVVSRSPIPYGTALRIVHDAADAVRAARDLRHELGGDPPPLHGAVGPYTLMVTRSGETKLTDPIVATTLVDTPGFDDNPGLMAYLAPDHFDGTIDERTDVFLFGVLLWEMIANRPLFGVPSLFRVAGPPRDPWDAWPKVQLIADKVTAVRKEPLNVVAARARTPDRVVELVDRALARDRGRRQATLDVLIDEIEALGAAVAGCDEVAATFGRLCGPRLEERLVSIMSHEERPSGPIEIDLPPGDRVTAPGPFIEPSKPVVIVGEEAASESAPPAARKRGMRRGVPKSIGARPADLKRTMPMGAVAKPAAPKDRDELKKTLPLTPSAKKADLRQTLPLGDDPQKADTKKPEPKRAAPPRPPERSPAPPKRADPPPTAPKRDLRSTQPLVDEPAGRKAPPPPQKPEAPEPEPQRPEAPKPEPEKPRVDPMGATALAFQAPPIAIGKGQDEAPPEPDAQATPPAPKQEPEPAPPRVILPSDPGTPEQPALAAAPGAPVEAAREPPARSGAVSLATKIGAVAGVLVVAVLAVLFFRASPGSGPLPSSSGSDVPAGVVDAGARRTLAPVPPAEATPDDASSPRRRADRPTSANPEGFVLWNDAGQWWDWRVGRWRDGGLDAGRSNLKPRRGR